MPHRTAQSGEILPMLSEPAQQEHSSTIIEGRHLRVVRLNLKEGEQQRPHVAVGDVVLLCPSGKVELLVDDKSRLLSGGEFVYLREGQSHALHAKAPSTVLIVHTQESLDPASAKKPGHAVRPDGAPEDEVEEASEESFPASDPPGYTP